MTQHTDAVVSFLNETDLARFDAFAETNQITIVRKFDLTLSRSIQVSPDVLRKLREEFPEARIELDRPGELE